MNQKRCKWCLDLFTPIRRNMVLTKFCTASCELDYAEKNPVSPKKPKLKKPKTAAWLKINKLWPLFSLHQKLVHSSDGEWCQCYTCDKPIKIGTTNCQGGHCLSKAVYKNLYFDERATRPQCYYCNVNLGGMHYDFCEKLKQEIGVDEFNEMKSRGKDIVKRNAEWYLERINYYKNQNEIIYKIKTNQ